MPGSDLRRQENGALPQPPGFNAFWPEWPTEFWGGTNRPAVPAPEAALRLRPRIALSSAQVKSG